MRTPQDWGQPCPKPAGFQYRRMPPGHVRALATYRTPSGQRRLLRCHTCATPCSETRATVFCDLRTSADQVMRALKLLLVRVAVAGIGFGLGGTADTGWRGLRRAAHPADALNRPRLQALPVTHGQRDELGNLIARQQTCETAAAGASGPDREEGRHWGWLRLAPELRLMSAAIVGPRTLAPAQEVVAAPKARVAGIPVCCRAGGTGALAALSAACHVVTTWARPGQRGCPRPPRGAPHPALVYGPWVQHQNPGKLLPRRTRVVLGAKRRTQRGLTLSTAWVARVPVT
jgi:hypothetical protein